MSRQKHEFSACCGVPLMQRNICSHCNQPAQVVTEDQYEDYLVSKTNLPLDLELITPSRLLTVIEFTPLDTEIEIHYHYADAIECSVIMVGKEDLCNWGKGKYWFPVFIRRFTDHKNEEVYEVLWSSRSSDNISGEGTPKQANRLNDIRRAEFISSINTKILEQYLCHTQQHLQEA